ncbi:MAG TPA: lysophospholipid acyltransferase family protein [Phycisphaerae bacterium]|nr:lysophospholipid acyltransferase family protein [Phycisphaerae bacterium]
MGYRLLRVVAQGFFVLYGRGRVFAVQHVPVTGPVLLACNHQSFFDPMLAALALPRECHFMARDTLFRNRHFTHLIRYLNAFPVKRGRADVGAIKESLRRLKQGALVIAFPEATRTRDGRIIPMQAGIVALARRANCPIVPTVIEGAYESWPRNQVLPACAPVWVEYGRAIEVREVSALGPDEAARYLTARLRSMHNALRRRIGRQPFDYEDSPVPTGEAAAGGDLLPQQAGPTRELRGLCR